MKAYTHYGVDVIRQIIDVPFRSVLDQAGVHYTELAIDPDLDIVTYVKDGVTKYALSCPINMPDDYGETVYITTQIPCDCDWMRLHDDIEGQVRGDAPMYRQTKLRIVIDQIYSIIDNDLELYKEMQMLLYAKGYDADRLRSAESYDIDPDFISKVISA